LKSYLLDDNRTAILLAQLRTQCAQLVPVLAPKAEKAAEAPALSVAAVS
jgi:hypothetical protein